MDQADMYRRSLVPSPDVLVQELPQGEIIFLHLGTEEYFGLDTVGTAMYHHLMEATTIGSAHERILEEFDVMDDRLRHDLVVLVTQLVKRGLIEFRGP